MTSMRTLASSPVSTTRTGASAAPWLDRIRNEVSKLLWPRLRTHPARRTAAEQQKVVMGGIQHIDIEMNRHPLGTRGSQPGEDRFSGCRNLLRANMGKPMLLDEARLERRRLGQSDIQNAAWVQRPGVIYLLPTRPPTAPLSGTLSSWTGLASALSPAREVSGAIA